MSLIAFSLCELFSIFRSDLNSGYFLSTFLFSAKRMTTCTIFSSSRTRMSFTVLSQREIWSLARLYISTICLQKFQPQSRRSVLTLTAFKNSNIFVPACNSTDPILSCVVNDAHNRTFLRTTKSILWCRPILSYRLCSPF